MLDMLASLEFSHPLGQQDSSPKNAKKLFNLRNSILRVTIERAFSALANRFNIVDEASPSFPHPS
jgi:hypothetical protein